jgi:hypothetical protein
MAIADRSHVERNVASRERLQSVLERLPAGALDRPVDGEWTPGALLAHVAFWDRLVAGRWRLAQRRGMASPADLDDDVADLVNDAALSAWRLVDGDRLTALVLSAADEVDELIAGLSDASVDAAAAAGRPRLVDRSFHRTEHLDTIERALDS